MLMGKKTILETSLVLRQGQNEIRKSNTSEIVLNPGVLELHVVNHFYEVICVLKYWMSRSLLSAVSDGFMVGLPFSKILGFSRRNGKVLLAYKVCHCLSTLLVKVNPKEVKKTKRIMKG